MTDQPKIKVKVKPPAEPVPAKNRKEEPVTTSPPKRKKGLLRKIVEIVSNDIRNLPDRIWGEKKKTVKIPDSKESWKDWEGQL